jgi:nitrogen regulatory protein PII 2
MKEIIAIIRPKMVSATKAALEELGFPGITAMAVLGRGRQRGIGSEVGFSIETELLAKAKSGGMKYVPKRYVSLVVPDGKVDEVVDRIVEVNQTASVGDGKIFVVPIEDAVRVRTGESGESAL